MNFWISSGGDASGYSLMPLRGAGRKNRTLEGFKTIAGGFAIGNGGKSERQQAPFIIRCLPKKLPLRWSVRGVYCWASGSKSQLDIIIRAVRD